MDWLDVQEPMTRRRALLLGVGSGNVSPGESSSHTFDVAGDYSYPCMLHRPMVGHLTVTA